MVAVAGYLNFTDEKLAGKLDTDGVIETAGQLLEENEEQEQQKQEDGQVTQTEASPVVDLSLQEEEGDEVADISAEDLGEDSMTVMDNGELAEKEEEETVGDAVLTNGTVGSDLFYSAKLTREQTRARNKEMLLELVNNKNITEKQKQDAINSIIEMTSVAEKESAAEILLNAKGFQNAMVSIIDGSVDVMINSKNITEQETAQIEDIVKRKTDIAAEHIVISTTGQ